MKLSRLPAALILVAAALPAAALEEVSFGTNWRAQAEHGGFYQAVADGSYADCGLDVTIVPGGPRVNNRALMLAGKLDFYMGGDLMGVLNAAAEGIPAVAVAAMFQKHPQVILTHPGAAESWQDLTDLTLLIADGGYMSFYQWMIAEWGFTPEQRAPYHFNPAPFLADPGVAMQGFLTSEPYTVRAEGGFDPQVFLIADAGYSTYSTMIEAMRATIEERRDVVQCFVDGSIRGWYNYLYGDNSAANARIKADNPEMTDDRIAHAVAQMKAHGIVDSGDAETLGIGVLTGARVQAFHDQMVAAGVLAPGIDWRAAVDTSFTGHGEGLELRPAE
jgi:NitT/TauT family transport system substrate-binding protein